jgi:hypothetical protein
MTVVKAPLVIRVSGVTSDIDGMKVRLKLMRVNPAWHYYMTATMKKPLISILVCLDGNSQNL